MRVDAPRNADAVADAKSLSMQMDPVTFATAYAECACIRIALKPVLVSCNMDSLALPRVVVHENITAEVACVRELTTY